MALGVLAAGEVNGRPSAQGDFEGYSGDSGGPVFRKGVLIGIARSVDKEGRARFSTRLDGMLVRGIKREKSQPVYPNANSRPAYLPEPAAKVSKPAALPDCPNGTCPLKPATYAAPVYLPASGCANGQCELPNYNRGGLFRRR
jgi:hypothetical protein